MGKINGPPFSGIVLLKLLQPCSQLEFFFGKCFMYDARFDVKSLQYRSLKICVHVNLILQFLNQTFYIYVHNNLFASMSVNNFFYLPPIVCTVRFYEKNNEKLLIKNTVKEKHLILFLKEKSVFKVVSKDNYGKCMNFDGNVADKKNLQIKCLEVRRFDIY